jgi:hypothetical protein
MHVEAPMHHDVEYLAEIAEDTYVALWANLTGISERELDWRPHPEANHCRWILGHLIWFEEWIPAAIAGTARSSSDGGPMSLEVGDIAEIRSRFDAARADVEEARARVTAQDLGREIDFFGETMTVKRLFATHVTHLAGHRYQIRYIRGIHAREHALNKAEFDRW